MKAPITARLCDHPRFWTHELASAAAAAPRQWPTASSTGAQGGPVCKICPLILTLDPYWGP